MMQKSKLGWVVTIGLSLSPLVMWALGSLPIGSRFSSTYMILTSLGQMTGLVGLSMFSINLFLSGRFKFVEDYFGGMNNVYVAHHILGGISFILMMVHPLVLGSAYLPISIGSMAEFLLPGADWTINLGIGSLLLVMSLLVLTFFVRLSYEVWLLSHKFLGVAFFLAGLHSFLVPSDISKGGLMWWYMLGIVSLGTIPYLYRTVLFRLLVVRRRYEVNAVVALSANVVEIRMIPREKKIDYLPGQFVFVGFGGSQAVSNEVHPFSVSSIPSDEFLAVTAKNEGDYTQRLLGLELGVSARVEGGFGRFCYQLCLNKNQIWIAGGIGITPFYSMARSLTVGSGYNIDLYYCVRDETEAVYLSELVRIAMSGVGLRLIPFYSKSSGRIGAEYVSSTSGDLIARDIFICGPPTMMKSLRNQFVRRGIRKSRLHTEEFNIL